MGLWVTLDAVTFQECNLDWVLEWDREDVWHWRSLPVSLMGRATLHKMIVLLKFLYLLQNTLFEVQEDFFQSLKALTRTITGWRVRPHHAINPDQRPL